MKENFYLVRWKDVPTYWSLQHAFLEMKRVLSLRADAPFWLGGVGPESDLLASSEPPDLFNLPTYDIHPVDVATFYIGRGPRRTSMMVRNECAGYSFTYFSHIGKAYIDTMHRRYGASLAFFHESVNLCRVLADTVSLLSLDEEVNDET